MDNELDKIIEDRLNSIPKEVKRAILSLDLSTILTKITQDNRLLIEQAGIFRNEVMLTLIGLTPLSDFTKNIAKQLEISTEKAYQISQDTDTLIFKNIRSYLQKLNEKENKEEQEQNTTQNSELDKDQILNEIENPQKSKVSYSPVQKTTTEENIIINRPATSFPMQMPEDDIVVKETSLPQKTDGITITNTVSDKESIDNILEANLKGTVSLEKEKKIVEEKTKLPNKGFNDPYREPIE